MRARWFPAGIVVLLLWTVAGCQRHAPGVLDYTLKDMNGRDVRLSDFRGHPLIINFWATWCGPCKAEMPDLIALAESEKAHHLAVVGISVDDAPEELRAFAGQYRVNYPLLVGRDRDDVAAAFGWAGTVPMTVFVKADGTVLKKADGPLNMYSKSWIDEQIRGLY